VTPIRAAGVQPPLPSIEAAEEKAQCKADQLGINSPRCVYSRDVLAAILSSKLVICVSFRDKSKSPPRIAPSNVPPRIATKSQCGVLSHVQILFIDCRSYRLP
jgi:hypothetical protein